MADLPEALDEALHGYYSPRADYVSPAASVRGFKARVRALEKAHGSKRAAAAAAGIDPTTWSRWSTGKQKVSARSMAKVGTAHTSLLRAAKLSARGYPHLIEITATVAARPVGPKKSKKSTYYNGGNPTATGARRKFRADKLTGPQIRDVVTAWTAGRGPQAVADVLLDAIQRAYGPRFAFEDSVTVEIT